MKSLADIFRLHTGKQTNPSVKLLRSFLLRDKYINFIYRSIGVK